MKAAVRCDALDMAGLKRMEDHGKRLDGSSQRRRIREADPLVVGGLDLRDLYDAHMDGAKQNKGAKKPVLHFIVRYPPEVLADDGPASFAILTRAERESRMLAQAVAFINETHGGRAVFAARVDRDEAGESIVDVFAAPLYEKDNVKRRATETWASATKFGKEIAERHQVEIRRRLPEAKDNGKPITTPRAVGMALQSEFASFFLRENGAALHAKKEKERPTPDRLGVEEWKAARAAWDQAEAEAEAERDEARADADKATKERDQARADEAEAVAKAQRITRAAKVLADEVNAGTIHRDNAGKILAQDRAGLSEGMPDLTPAIHAGADAGAALRRVDEAAKVSQRDAEATAARIRAAADEDRRIAAQERQKADEQRTEADKVLKEATGLRARLRKGIRMVEGWLNLPELPASLRAKATGMLKALKESPGLLPPEDTPPKPPRGGGGSGGDSGPGF